MSTNASQSAQFEDYPFFKHLMGEWTCERDIRTPAGETVNGRQDWRAAISDEKAFTIEIADETAGQVRHIKWTYTHMAPGLFEAMCQPDVNKPVTQHHTAKLAENGLRMELTRLFDNGSEVTVTYTFKDEGCDVLEVKITLIDDSGTTLYKDSSVMNKKNS